MGPGPGGGQWGGRRQQNFKWQGAIHHWQGFSPEELGSFSKEEDFLTTLSKSHVFPSLLPQWLCPESIQKRREIGKPETKSLKSPLEKVNCIADFILLVLCCEEFSFELKEFCVFKHMDSVASRGADLIGGKVWATPASPSSWFSSKDPVLQWD